MDGQDIEFLRNIIHSRDRGQECMCIPAEESHDNKEHFCVMHADIKRADKILDELIETIS